MLVDSNVIFYFILSILLTKFIIINVYNNLYNFTLLSNILIYSKYFFYIVIYNIYKLPTINIGLFVK